MLRNIKLILLFLLFLSAALVDARAEEVLMWQDCVNEAKDNHPNIISAREAIKVDEADKYIAMSTILPQISGTAIMKRKETYKRLDSTITDTYSYSMTGQQLLFDGFKTSAEVSSSSKELTASQYNYAVISSNIRSDLREAFVELLKAQELIPLTEKIESRRRENLELVRLRYEAGREHKGSLLTSQADVANAEFETAQAKRNLNLRQRQLTKELGRKEMSPIRALGSIQVTKDYKEKPDFEHLAENSPVLRKLIALTESADFDLKSAEADFIPKVYLNASLGKTDPSWPPRDEEWSLGMSVSVPIFEGGSRFAEVAKAKSQLHQAEANQRSGRDSVLVTLENTWKELQDSIAYVSVQKKFLEAAQERAKITSAQYEKGLTSFDDWIIIEDNLVNAKKSYLNAQTDMLIAEAYWIQAIGGTLEYEE